MKRLLFAASLALALPACTPGGVASIPPAPLSHTTIDEKALTLAAKAVDTAALSASALVRVGVIEPGSPSAQRLARALDDARNAVNAAEAAREAGSATSYADAIAKANSALAAINTVIGG
jgi:hypothetical protein